MKQAVTEIKFTDFPIVREITDALADEGIIYCTGVQKAALPAMLEGRDVIAEAPTGTGKTYAFGIPLIQAVDPEENAVQALILAPTRELVQQISDEIHLLTQKLPTMTSLAIIGGSGMKQQITALKTNPKIIIATPGRLIDHIKRGRVQLDRLRMLILDEADRMLDMGFIEDVRFILDRANPHAQMGFFSATLSREVMDVSWLYQKQPKEVKVEAAEEDKPQIKEYYVIANGSERIDAILDFKRRTGSSKVLVFVNLKQSADITAEKLSEAGLPAAALQGDMPQKNRNKVMRAFREEAELALVATDIAARGLDVENVDLVFNYDLPQDTENYIHRVGRTGRAGKHGVAISFIAPGEEENFAKYCRALHIEPELLEWERTQKKHVWIDEDEAAAVARRIRARSQYLKKNDPADRYDPYAAQNYTRRGRTRRRKPDRKSNRRSRNSGNRGRHR